VVKSPSGDASVANKTSTTIGIRSNSRSVIDIKGYEYFVSTKQLNKIKKERGINSIMKQFMAMAGKRIVIKIIFPVTPNVVLFIYNAKVM
jgi:hypothetical protein